MLNPKYIPTVLAILSEGSFSAAARKLFVTQPALSQTIRQIEEELGTPILDRGTNPVILTQAGKLYMEAALQILDIDRNLHARVNAEKHVASGTLSVGVSRQRSLQLLPTVFPRFRHLWPYVRLVLHEHGSGDLERMVRVGQCDLAFITTFDKPDRLSYRLVQTERTSLIACRSTRLAERIPDGTPISIAEAAEESFISMKEGHSIRVIQDRLFRRYDLQPEILFETDSMELAKRVTARSGAVFLIPDVYMDSHELDRSLVNCYPIRDNDSPRHFYLCHRSGLYLTAYMKDLVNLVCDALNVPELFPAAAEERARAQ